MVDATEATGLLVKRARPRDRIWGVAVSAITGAIFDTRDASGGDPIGPDTAFEIGSLTKTVTGVLLAQSVALGETTLATTVGDVLTNAGHAARVTLRDLATQRSGLGRLPPNLTGASILRQDPYAAYTREELIAALSLIEPPTAGRYQYSNFGFMLLGVLLEVIAGLGYPQLAATRVFGPLGLSSSGCPPPPARQIPVYAGRRRVKWWSFPLPGAGGIGMSIGDLTTYLQAHLDPHVSPLGEAITLATTIHAETPPAAGLGWAHEGGGWWHNGATGGSRAFAAFHRPTRTAVALLANSRDADTLEGVGTRTLTELVAAAPRRA